MSVCLSVYLSIAGIVSKRLYESSNILNTMQIHYFVFLGSIQRTKLQGEPSSAVSRKNCVLCRPSLKWSRWPSCYGLAWKLQVPDQSVSVPMTLSDLEKRDARGPVFPVIIRTGVSGQKFCRMNIDARAICLR